MKKIIIFILAIISALSLTHSSTYAACDFSTMDPENDGTFAFNTTCGINAQAIDGVDWASGNETATNNTAAFNISGGAFTVNAGTEGNVTTFVTGTINITGGSIAIGDTYAQIKINAPKYCTDTDADGWATDFTFYDATASGLRRCSLMSSLSTIDCDDAANSSDNSCGATRYGDGIDGAVTISANTNINTANSISGRSCADGGDAVNYSVSSLTDNTAVLTSTPASGCLAADDYMLLINQQGTSSNYTNVGNYEVLKISSISTNTITFTENKINKYGNGASDDTNIGTATTNQRVILQRVPQYSNLTVNASQTFSANDWNQVKSGVMAFYANGTITVNGTIDVSTGGYSAGTGGADRDGGGSFCSNDGGGTGGYTNQNGSAPTAGLCGGGGGSGYYHSGAAGSATGGAGGGGGNAIASSGSTKAGGGGAGGYGTAGTGGKGYNNGVNGGTNTRGAGGNGGSPEAGYAYGGGGGGGGTYGDATLTDIFFGSGGGAGASSNGGASRYGGAGGTGGGIVLIQGSTITLGASSSINANGGNGGNGYNESYRGGDGGGASGGSIKLVGDTLTLQTTKVTATGGASGASSNSYDGGVGGVGRIRIEYLTSLSGTTSPAASSSQE